MYRRVLYQSMMTPSAAVMSGNLVWNQTAKISCFPFGLSSFLPPEIGQEDYKKWIREILCLFRVFSLLLLSWFHGA